MAILCPSWSLLYGVYDTHSSSAKALDAPRSHLASRWFYRRDQRWQSRMTARTQDDRLSQRSRCQAVVWTHFGKPLGDATQEIGRLGEAAQRLVIRGRRPSSAAQATAAPTRSS